MSPPFGEYLRKLRIDRDMSLRKFSTLAKIDPGNLSRIERGRLRPPGNKKVEEICDILGLEPSTDEWRNLVDYAYLGRKEIPKELLSDEELLTKLPILFRKVTGAKLTDGELDSLIEAIRKA